MAAMATFPPITSSYDLPVFLLPNNIYDDIDDIVNMDLHLLFSGDSPMDFPVLPDIQATNDAEQYNGQTDLNEIELSPFQTPPTPEPEPSPTQKPEVTQDVSKQETNNVVDSFSLGEEVKIKCEQNEWPCPEKQQQQQQQQQQKFKESETKMENDETGQQEPLSKDDETLPTAEERPTRRCNSRYQFRHILGSSGKQSRPTVRKTVVLWKFLEELLDTNENNCVTWVSREEGTFKFVDSKLAAKLWGQRKNKRNMTYEKLSRALRYYYDRQIMFHEEGQKLIYRFGDVVMKNRKQSAVEPS